MHPASQSRWFAFAFVLALPSAVAPAGAAALDLKTAWREAAAAHPRLAAWRARVEAAERGIAPAGAWSPPMLELGVVNVPANGRFDMDPMTMKMVGLAQRVPLFGGTGLRAEAARAGVAGEAAQAEAAAYELFAEVGEAYADAYAAGELVRVAAAHEGELERSVRAARARYESAAGRLEDVLRAEAERARARSDQAAFAGEETAARARLDALRGRDPGDDAGDELAPPPALDVPEDPGPWLAALTPAHPRIRALAARGEQDRRDARALRRMVWPDLELRFSYGFRQAVMDVPQDNMWSATVGFMLPLFYARREGAQAAAMDARARAAEADVRAASLDLAQQVRSTHAYVRAGQRTAALLADTVLVARHRALEAAWAGYRAGGDDLRRVLEVAHERYQDEIDLVRSRQALGRAEARLLALTSRADLFGVSVPAFERSTP
jgi:outer membrane protein TolC